MMLPQTLQKWINMIKIKMIAVGMQSNNKFS